MLCEGAVVGRIMKSAAAPVGQPWLWTLPYGHHEDHTPTHGYEPTRETAMAAFAKSWRRKTTGERKAITEAAYFDNRFNAESHSRSGSRSPAFASSMISLASVRVVGSLRSTNPSFAKAASNGVVPRRLQSRTNDCFREQDYWA